MKGCGWYRIRNGNKILALGVYESCRYMKTADGRWHYYDEWDGSRYTRSEDVSENALVLDYIHNATADLFSDKKLIVSEAEFEFLKRIVT